MLKEVHKQLYKMTFVLFLLFSLGLWAREFVVHAIGVAIFLNVTIFGSFFFGVFIAYRNVFLLKNEFLAFEALKEDYEDITSKQDQDAADPYWRYYRCEAPAVMFKTPHILEQPYQIISEEIASTRGLSMSTGEMQNLLDTVHEGIHGQRSLVTFVTGIQIMLGLLGTFVGLMETLSSVGAIISGLDLSGAGGTAAIQGLMEDLGVPLQGMATGFSSSLFGLITSLTLGILSRFSNQASDLLKSHFATWLAGVAKVAGNGVGGAGGGLGGSKGFSPETERMLAIMYRVAKVSLVSNARITNSVERLNESALMMMNCQTLAGEATLRIGHTIQALCESQTRTTEAVLRIADQMETREEMRVVVGELRQSAAAYHQRSDETNRSLDLVARQIAQIRARAAEKEQTFATRDDMSKLLAEAQAHVGGEFANLHGSVENLQSVMAEIERASGASASAVVGTRLQIDEMRRELKVDLEEAITSSRVAIQRADEIARQNTTLSVGEMQQLLVSHFSQLAAEGERQVQAAQEEPREPKDSKSRGLFGLFNRRAG
jgi:hypothetical protein